MIVVRDLQSTYRISDSDIRDLVKKRLSDLGGDSFDSNALGYMVVIEEGDNIVEIEDLVGFNILHNRLNGVRYDHATFTPSFEFIEDLPCCFDMVFVIDDTGKGIEIFVPKGLNLDTALVAMCRKYAYLQHPEDPHD